MFIFMLHSVRVTSLLSFLTISAVQSRSRLESRLQALQCHFTWDLDLSRFKLSCLRDELEDTGAEEQWMWMGHVYNLQGFIHFQLGFIQDAQSFFTGATEAFCQLNNTREGPWLVVNYGNLAWLHHRLGEEAKSREYLSKAEALMGAFPSPSPLDPHPEICAERAWTLMRFSEEAKLQAVDYFERAIAMQPGSQEWRTNQVIALVKAIIFLREDLDDDVLEEMRRATERDPEDLYLAVLYLEARALKGENIKDEARCFARTVLQRLKSSYGVFEPLQKLFGNYLSVDEAVELAEDALERDPHARRIRRCAAVSYKKKVYRQKMTDLEPSTVDRAISLCREVIELYPHSNLKIQIALAVIYSRSRQQARADQMFTELLESQLDPEGKQIVYLYYANHLFYSHKEKDQSVRYMMMAAEIPYESFYRQKSIRTLEKIRDRNQHPGCEEIKTFLDNLSR